MTLLNGLMGFLNKTARATSTNFFLLNNNSNGILSKCSINRTSFNQIVQVHNENRRGIFARDHGPRGNHYKPYVNKRIQTYGLATRLQSRGGKQMLWRKIIKGPKGWIGLVPAP